MKTGSCSQVGNYIPELAAKMRHFYDLYYLLSDTNILGCLKSDAFKSDFNTLFVQDQQRLDKPAGWQDKRFTDSPIITQLHSVWTELSRVYARELPDLAYKEIPSIEHIEHSMRQLVSYLSR